MTRDRLSGSVPLRQDAVGASVHRLEDRRLLTGMGRYVGDLTAPNMTHAVFVRSPFPHALIRAVRTDAALALRGVLAVLTGKDLRRLVNPCTGLLPLEGLHNPTFAALATDRVRFVGDPVAIVVAESMEAAADAATLVDVDYEALPVVPTAEAACLASSPIIWPKAGSNVLYRKVDRYGDVDGRFAEADRIVAARFEQHRHSPQPMEPRGMLAEVIPSTGRLIVHSSTQSVHTLKWTLAFLLGADPVGRSLQRLAANPRRLHALGCALRRFARENPETLGAARSLLPAFLKQARSDPMRLVALAKALLSVMSTNPADFPTVLAPDIGGSFGVKWVVSREDAAVCAAARHLGRPVRWIESRSEHLCAGGQAREDTVDVQAAVRDDGKLLALRVKMVMDAGAYPAFPFPAALFARAVKALIPGPYRLEALEFDTRIVSTNKATYVPYRGPWAVETWVRERLLDLVAGQLNMGRAAIRLRNMVGSGDLPTRMITGPVLDVRMSARSTLERALEITGFDGWEDQKAAARRQGRHLGLGVATYIEPAPGPRRYLDSVVPGFAAVEVPEVVELELERDGTMTLRTQQVPHGQGHETTLAQVAADVLNVPVAAVRVQFGDTRRTPFGVIGTGGSRSATMAGGAATIAAQALRDRIVEAAASLLAAAPDDLVIGEGRVSVRSAPSISVTFGEVAAAARYVATSGPRTLKVRRAWDGGPGGWSQATHACFVEVDVETGRVRIPRYVVVEDCGRIINPAIVEGQIQGGVAQGIGAVFYEKSTYDADGQYLAATFMDYLVPSAVEIPNIEIHHLETPSSGPMDFRGVGEGALIGAPAAITNAVEDALSEFGVRITEQHLPPCRILELIGTIGRRP